MEIKAHNFFRPWAPHRIRIYQLMLILGVLITFIPWGGVVAGIFDPRLSYWAWGILIYIPLLVPLFVAWWDAPGENRTQLERAFEFIVIWFPVTASSQITWEIPYLILDALGYMNGAGPENVGLWIWWGYGIVDTRYLTSDPSIFGMECVAVLGGLTLFRAFLQLRKAMQSGDQRNLIAPLWWGFFSLSLMWGVVLIYFIEEIYNGFGNLKYDHYGYAYSFWYVFVFMNIWWAIAPLIALPYTRKIIDYLYRSELARELTSKSVSENPAVVPANKG